MFVTALTRRGVCQKMEMQKKKSMKNYIHNIHVQARAEAINQLVLFTVLSTLFWNANSDAVSGFLCETSGQALPVTG